MENRKFMEEYNRNRHNCYNINSNNNNNNYIKI